MFRLILVILSTSCFLQAQTTISFANWKSSGSRNQVFELDPGRYISDFQKYVFSEKLITELDYKIPSLDQAGFAEEVVLEIPMPDGHVLGFRLFKNTTLAPELLAEFPFLHTYQGAAVEDPSTIIFCEVTQKGFHGMILSDNRPTVIIQPYGSEYIVFDRSKATKSSEYHHDCLTQNDAHNRKIGKKQGQISERTGDCKVRQFKIAIAATGEYTTFHSGPAGAISAMTTSVNRVNGILQKEVGAVLQIVGNNSSVIYPTASTDPYTNSNPFTMLGENQTTLDGVIGTGNYDVGHVFGTGSSGVAYIGVNCDVDYKGQAVSRAVSPSGDNFDIDIFAHELGHTLGALHSHYAQSGNCGGSITSSSCYEPGSGSTIMSYSGVCNTADNVQVYSDDYFHAISLSEIGDNLTATNCGTILQTLTRPTANAGSDYSINKNSAFILKGSATNGGASGVTLSYCWEQMNNEVISDDGNGNIVTYTSPPNASNVGGPNFRSFKPGSASTYLERSFPRYQVLNGSASNAFEMLPNVARALNFRFTVRSVNASGRGCTAEDDLVVTVVNSSPFSVTAPALNANLSGGSSTTVTWNVNSSNTAPINMSNVDILFSSDSGKTYSNLLLNTPNDGTQAVTLQAMSPKFTISFNASFPVSIVKFSAHPKSNSISVAWITENEQNNKGYILEKSIIPESGFAPIGWIEPNLEMRYEFEDSNARKGVTYYYRLKQLDYDGKTTITNVVSSVIPTATKEVSEYLLAYPNPVKAGVLKIFSNVFDSQGTTIQIINTSGLVLQSEFLKMNNNQEYELDVSRLTGGMYFINLVQNKKSYYSKFTIVTDY